MSTIVKGNQVEWSGSNHRIIQVDADLAASRAVGVWLVDGNGGDASDDQPFRMVIGVRTEEDAARAYVAHVKATGHAPPVVIRVFPLASLEPIGLTGIVDQDGDETWSAFSDAWVEVRL